MTFHSLDDHELVPVSHFWDVDATYTLCGECVEADMLLSPDPTCLGCRGRLAEDARLLAQLTEGNAMNDLTKISCGCCRGPIEDRCCCWFHQDRPHGIVPKVCTRHQLTAPEAESPYFEEAARLARTFAKTEVER